MDITVMNMLRNIVEDNSALSRLDKVTALSFLDNVESTYQSGLLTKMLSNEVLSVSERQKAVSAAADIRATVTCPISNGVDSDYICEHFTESFASLFMEYELVTQEDIDNFADDLIISDAGDKVSYSFESQHVIAITLYTDKLKKYVCEEITSRFMQHQVECNSAVFDKVLNLSKDFLLSFFDDDFDLYICCILTVLKNATDKQLKDIYNKLYNT